MEADWPNVLDAVLNNPDRQASWHFSILRDGTLYQHYEIEDICWHCGLPGDERRDTSLIGNITLVGEEHEGYAGEPLTLAAKTTTIQLTADLRMLCPIPEPPELRKNLWEHNWLSSTACPSGRIPWAEIIPALEENHMPLTDADKQWINEAVNNQLKTLQTGMLTNIATNADLRMTVIMRAIAADDAKAAQILGVTPADIAKAVADEQARRLQA